MNERRTGPIFLRTHLRARPDVTVTQITLGLTIYLADAGFWATGGARALFERFLDLAPRSHGLRWFATSTGASWRTLTRETLPAVSEHLAVGHLSSRVRHLFEFRAADDTGAPSLGFCYREVDPSDPNRTGFIQIVLPAETPPGDLFQLAMEVGHGYPIYSAVAGWIASYSRHHEREAFERIHNQCRRYLGLDVQVPDAASRHARDGLVGASWLTFVGAPLAERVGIDVQRLVAHPWRTDVTVLPLRRALLIRAGADPILGDVNLMEYPAAQAEVATMLATHLMQDRATMPGRFGDEDATMRWARRFVEPLDWM